MATAGNSVEPVSEVASETITDNAPRIKFKRLVTTAKHIMQILYKEALEEVRTQRKIFDIKLVILCNSKWERKGAWDLTPSENNLRCLFNQNLVEVYAWIIAVSCILPFSIRILIYWEKEALKCRL